MIGAIIGGLYGAIGLVVARVVAGWQAYDFAAIGNDVPRPDAEAWIFGGFMGLIAGLIWPVLALALILRLVPLRGPKEKDGRRKAKEAELRKREEWVARKERELGIR